METFKIWDTLEKGHLFDGDEFNSQKEAEDKKDQFLQAGNYYNRSHSVLEIHKYIDGKFEEDVTYGN